MRRNDSGFTLMETMIALGILSFGLLAMGQVMAFGIGMMSTAGPDMLARQKAAEAIESVFTSRDTRTTTWARIRNEQGASGTDGGVFNDGELPLTTAGLDGLVNTDDDGPVESIVLPGPDGLLGTGDDLANPLDGFTREIEIRDVDANLRRIRVTIRYNAGPLRREYVLETFISSFA
ncbi:MAG: prepilin-type N-terminal cleavage/methylation domain-containing protein [Vicinamibacterales bacterium]